MGGKDSKVPIEYTDMQQVTITINDKPTTFDYTLSFRLIEVRLSDSEGHTKGIWANLNEPDVAEYEANCKDVTMFRLVALASNPLEGPPWGSFIPCQFDGDSQPVLNLAKTKLSGPVVYCTALFELGLQTWIDLKEIYTEILEACYVPVLSEEHPLVVKARQLIEETQCRQH